MKRLHVSSHFSSSVTPIILVFAREILWRNFVLSTIVIIKHYYLRQCDRCSLSVIRSVCYYSKSNQRISLKLDDMIGPTNRKKGWTFGGDPIPDTDSGSLLYFPHHRGIWNFRTFIRISHTHLMSPADFHDTQWNDWRRQDNESTTFWERSESILLRIRISNHFWLWLDALAEVYAFTSTEHGTSRGLSARAELLVTNLQCTGWQYCPLLRSPRVHVQQEMTMIVNILNAEVCRCRRGDLKTGHHLTVKTATETRR